MLFTRKNLSVQMQAPEEHIHNNGRLFLVRGKDDTGSNAYYFVLLDRKRIGEFQKVALGSSPFDLKEYGEIVASGYGETVPEALRIRMRVEHGWA